MINISNEIVLIIIVDIIINVAVDDRDIKPAYVKMYGVKEHIILYF